MGNIISFTDVLNWGSETEDQKIKIIAQAEELIEKITGIKFYQDNLDYLLDGNGKNRIFTGLKSPLLSISSITIFSENLDSAIYTFDDYSIFLDPSSVLNVEVKHLLREYSSIFPRGENNVHVIGTYGYAVAPENIQKCAIMLSERSVDGSLYTHVIEGSESIGSYSYTRKKVLTGIVEVDEILRHYISKTVVLRA